MNQKPGRTLRPSSVAEEGARGPPGFAKLPRFKIAYVARSAAAEDRAVESVMTTCRWVHDDAWLYAQGVKAAAGTRTT